MNTTKHKSDLNFEFEDSLSRDLLSLETKFAEHLVLLNSTMNEQQTIIDAMWVQCQRFLILTRGVPCVCPYPLEVTNREKQNISAEFNSKKKLLNASRIKMTASLYNVREKSGAFDRAVAKVDTSVPSQILEGDQSHQPIYYYIELFADAFKFFVRIQNKLNLLGKFLMIEDIDSILEYKKLLEPDKVVNDYFETYLHIGKINH